MSSRWIRLDTTWSTSSWLADLEPLPRLLWPELLCYVKAHGTGGTCRRAVAQLAGVTGVTRDMVMSLETAAINGDALQIEGGNWVVTNWDRYQRDTTAAERKRAQRERNKGVSDAVTSQVSRVTSVTSRNVTPTETETETNNPPVVPPAGGKRAPRKKPATSIPDDWQPNDSHREFASAEGLDLTREAESFRAHAIANDRRLVEWNAAFRQWLLRAEPAKMRPLTKAEREHVEYRPAHEVLW